MVQDGLTTPQVRAELASELCRLEANEFGLPSLETTVRFVVVDDGSGFTAGEASTTSIVIAEVLDGRPYSLRKSLMSQICDLWYRTTGCSTHELVVFTTDEIFDK